MARGRVLALRPLYEAAGDRRGPRLRRAALELLDVPEPERLEIREIEPAHRARDVSEGVGALVPIVPGVGQRSRADRIEHDHARPRHAAILEPDGHRSWHARDLVWVVVVIALAMAVTWVTVKLFPERKSEDAALPKSS